MNSIDWELVLTDETADPVPLVTHTVDAVEKLLAARPEGEREVLAILEKRLRDPIDQGTWQATSTCLAHYLDLDFVYLLTWIVQPTDASARLNQVEEQASPRVAAFVRAIMGIYDTELRTALKRSNELPDDWASISREVFFDELERRYVVRVKIEKYNGDVVQIGALPNSLLDLTTQMLRTCRLVGSADAFNKSSVEGFEAEREEFRSLLDAAKAYMEVPGQVSAESPAVAESVK